MTSEKLKQLLEFSIININKPSGPTSFSVSDFVRKALQDLGVRKTSHFGTLDPKVTGVLPIALNRACKLTGFFLGHDKTYVGIMHVNNEITIEKLQEIINKNFLGKIKQLPPRKSRVKREEREREIIEFKILEKQEKNFLFTAKVQGGTYIRKLISDLGEDNKLNGAHMLELRRTQAGIFEETKSINLYKFKEAVENAKQGDEKLLINMLVPAEEAIKKILPCIQVKEQEVKKLLTGKPIFFSDLENPDEIPKEGKFALFFREKFIEIARVSHEGDIIARPEFVLNKVS
jgi:H/ACA ribonucleoprotein complex subunit 4